MITTAKTMAICNDREYGLVTFPSGEADIVVTRIGSEVVLEFGNFPDRNTAIEQLRIRLGVPKSGQFPEGE